MLNRGLRLPQDVFEDSFRIVPRMAIVLFVTCRNRNFLLTRRNIEPELGKWHLPGTFLLRGEAIEYAMQRVLQNELGVKGTIKDLRKLKDDPLAVRSNFEDPRGHVVDVAYKYKVSTDLKVTATRESSDSGFFGENALPRSQDIGFKHTELIKYILKKLTKNKPKV